jgi:cell division protein FtsB
LRPRAEPVRRPAHRPAPAGSVGRARLLLVGAVVLSAIILFAWFPFSPLLHQQAALSAADAQLSGLHTQDGALSQENKNLSDAAEIGRIAREQYQLVSPGQQAYEVLPPAGSSDPDVPYAGDPGSRAPVAPTASSELPPGGVTTTTAPVAAPAHGPTSTPSSGSGMLARMLHTLEFWR